MTREKAKRNLVYAIRWNDMPKKEALDMAIKALEQEPCEDVMSRILKRMWNCRGKHTTSIDKVKMEQILRDELPPVKPQYTEDEIQKMQDLERAEIEKAYELGKAEGQESEVAISRQAVLSAMRRNHRSGGRDIDDDYIEGDYRERLYDDIISLPPVIPQPKMGRWIYDDEYSNWFFVTYKCSCCEKAIIVPYEARREVYKDYPYCHCGAKMESEDKE